MLVTLHNRKGSWILVVSHDEPRNCLFVLAVYLRSLNELVRQFLDGCRIILGVEVNDNCVNHDEYVQIWNNRCSNFCKCRFWIEEVPLSHGVAGFLSGVQRMGMYLLRHVGESMQVKQSDNNEAANKTKNTKTKIDFTGSLHLKKNKLRGVSKYCASQ